MNYSVSIIASLLVAVLSASNSRFPSPNQPQKADSDLSTLAFGSQVSQQAPVTKFDFNPSLQQQQPAQTTPYFPHARQQSPEPLPNPFMSPSQPRQESSFYPATKLQQQQPSWCGTGEQVDTTVHEEPAQNFNWQPEQGTSVTATGLTYPSNLAHSFEKAPKRERRDKSGHRERRREAARQLKDKKPTTNLISLSEVKRQGSIFIDIAKNIPVLSKDGFLQSNLKKATYTVERPEKPKSRSERTVSPKPRSRSTRDERRREREEIEQRKYQEHCRKKAEYYQRLSEQVPAEHREAEEECPRNQTEYTAEAYAAPEYLPREQVDRRDAPSHISSRTRDSRRHYDSRASRDYSESRHRYDDEYRYDANGRRKYHYPTDETTEYSTSSYERTSPGASSFSSRSDSYSGSRSYYSNSETSGSDYY